MTKTNTKPTTPENMRALAMELIDYLNEVGCWFDMGIYVDGEHWTTAKWYDDNGIKRRYTENGTVYYIEKNVDVKSRLEYNNPDTITLWFEGPVYERINDYDMDFLHRLEKKFLEPYGLFFEQGYAWSAAAYSNYNA